MYTSNYLQSEFFNSQLFYWDMIRWEANFSHVTYASVIGTPLYSLYPLVIIVPQVTFILFDIPSVIIKTFVAKPCILYIVRILFRTRTHWHMCINEIKMCYANIREKRHYYITVLVFICCTYIIIWRVYGAHCTLTSELVCSDNYAARWCSLRSVWKRSRDWMSSKCILK